MTTGGSTIGGSTTSTGGSTDGSGPKSKNGSSTSRNGLSIQGGGSPINNGWHFLPFGSRSNPSLHLIHFFLPLHRAQSATLHLDLHSFLFLVSFSPGPHSLHLVNFLLHLTQPRTPHRQSIAGPDDMIAGRTARAARQSRDSLILNYGSNLSIIFYSTDQEVDFGYGIW